MPQALTRANPIARLAAQAPSLIAILRALRDAFAQARSAHAGQQPRDLRHRRRRGARDRPVRCAICSTGQPALFSGQIAAWLWFTVLFANFAEAIAEGRGKAQADALAPRHAPTRRRQAHRCMPGDRPRPLRAGRRRPQLRPGDVVLVEAGDMIPGDGEIIEGIASVNEAAITGESAPGDPRGRRRPLGRHRRHHGDLRLDRGADHRRAGLHASSTA